MAPGSSPTVALSPGAFGAYQIAWTGDNGDLWASDPIGGATTDLGLRPAPNSSPSITGSLPGASVNTGQQVGYEVAFHGNADHPGVSGGLFGSGFTTANLSFLVAKGTNPSVTAIGANGYQIAFQDINTHELVTTGSDGTVRTGLPMAPNTSPSIVGLPGGGYVIAFQHAGDGTLWTTSNIHGTHQVAGQMAPGTSPAAANLPNGGAFQIVWQGANNHLWTTGIRPTDLGVAMAPGTNPSVAILPNGVFSIAYQSNFGAEEVYSSDPTIISGGNGGPMWPGTSPSIAATPASAQWPNGGFEVAYTGTDGRLYGAGTIANNPIVDAGSPNGYQVQPGTSPAILGVYLPTTLVGSGNLIPGYQIAFQEANTRSTWITEASPAFTTKHTLTNAGVLMNPTASPRIANLGRS